MQGTDKRRWKTLVQMLAGTFNRDLVDVLICTVDSVDENAMTCECTAISSEASNSIPGVKLNAEANDGFLIIPQVGSTVLLGTSSRNNYYVLLYSDIDKVICVIDSDNSFEFSSQGFVWNNGTFGGMAKTGVLKTKLNAIETVINQLIATKNLIQAAGTSSPGTPVTNGTLATFFTGVTPTPLTPTTQAEIEDNKIKH